MEKTRQNCLHSEPNYGVLWFYFKDSLLDNAYEIWDQAQYDIEKEYGKGSDPETVYFMGSQRLSNIIKSGMKIGQAKNNCSFEEKVKVVYGFEQILPQIAHI